jgi:hypothetical protein
MNMTLEIKDGDRIYKIIEARTFGSNRKNFISKIDRSGRITVLTYTFSEEDVKEDGTISNKLMMMLIKDMDEDQFKSVIDLNYKTYPGFKILREKDYSNKSLEEAVRLMKLVYPGILH